MKFCTICESIMEIRTTASGVSFVCDKCKTVTPGIPEDTLISGDPTGGMAGVESQQKILLEQLPFDPASFYVYRDCPCGMDIMARAVIGLDMQIFYVCRCGNVEKAKK